MGHPVDVGSGAFFSAWHDIEMGGYAPLVFRRYFSTSLTGDASAGLGAGWTHNFAIQLVETTDRFRLRDQNGSWIDFPRPADRFARSVLQPTSSMELRLENDGLCVYHWHDWRTAVEKLWFRRLAGGFRLERVAPPSGFGLTLEYDAAGRLASVVQMVEGRRIAFVYDDRGLLRELRLRSPVSVDRPVASYAYDDGGRLAEVRDALDSPIRYAYDRAGRMVREDTRSGAVFLMRYDREGRCVGTHGADGYHACSLQYLAGGRAVLMTNAVGGITTYQLNANGQVLKETHPNGASLTLVYDDAGRIVDETDAMGRSTAYAYDAQGNTTKVTYPSGRTIQVAYDDEHQPTQIQQGDRTWRFGYARGQVTSIIDPFGVEQRYTYSPRGHLAGVREPTGNVVRIEPDEAWGRVRYSDSLGFEREEHYNDLMDITQIVEPDGGVYRFEFDAVGRLVRATAPESPPREYSYDGTGCLATATDADGFTVRLRHDSHGNLHEILTPTGRTYRCEWDRAGNLTAWVNPAGERAEFEYDAVGSQIRAQHFDGRSESCAYDLAGRAVRRTLADGTVLEFAYDLADNLVLLRGGGVEMIAAEYDTDGRLAKCRTPDTDVSFEYGGGLRITAEVQNGRRVEYTYDGTGALSSRTFAGSPLPPLQFEWDRRRRLVRVYRGDSVVQTLAYDAKDQCVDRHFGECLERFEYDVAGRVVHQSVTRGDSLLVERRWTHDGRGNVARIADQRTGERRFEIDGDHRLIRSIAADGVSEYAYDARGLLTAVYGARSRQLTQAAGGRVILVGNRLYERDANGNVVRISEGDAETALSWDALGQLVELRQPNGTVSRFTYDGLGRRVAREADGVRTDFVWAGEQLLAEISDQVVTEVMLAEVNPTTVWRDGELIHLVDSHLGVPQEALTGDGRLLWWQRLDDWGALEAGEGSVGAGPRFRLPGQLAEPPFHYNRFRYYDPESGQYLSPDPIGLAGGANEYAYCPNPINWLDPFGLSCGIAPGQQSVYVLEKGKRANPGPPPTPAVPPTPPEVIYVGITRQSPHARLSQHRGKPPGGVSPDGMRIIASGPPQVPDRTAARLMEASILHNNPVQPGQAGALNNKGRPVNPGYYHSNIPSSAPNGTTYLPASQTSGLLNPGNGTVIT